MFHHKRLYLIKGVILNWHVLIHCYSNMTVVNIWSNTNVEMYSGNIWLEKKIKSVKNNIK